MADANYDICVVGAGIAGALIAAEATGRGQRVVVIEAGRRYELADRSNRLHRYQTLREPRWPWINDKRDCFVDSSQHSIGTAYPLNRHRLKGLGGSTLHWEGRINRLMPTDFRAFSAYGHGYDWPITYDELEPYYSRADWEIGVSGAPSPHLPWRSRGYPMPGFPLAHEDNFWMPVADRLGFSVYAASHAINSVARDGRSQCMAYAACELCPSGARYSADFHMQKAEASGLCDVLIETSARRIDLDSGGRVRAIHCTTLDGRDREIRAKQYVIAAHAVESARLLLLSDCGNQSDQVGRNFMEHIYTSAGGYMEQSRNHPQRIGFSRMESMHFYDGAERRHRNAIKLEFSYHRDPLMDMEPLKLWGPALASHDREYFGKWVMIQAETEMHPHADSRVTLHPTQTDVFGDPAPDIRLAFSDIDRQTQHAARDIMKTLLDAASLRQIRQLEMSFGSHHMGTCRMSDDPDLGVVDRNCRVHGTTNLYVTGSSVFPTSGAVQPTLTIAALSLRLAEHLATRSLQ